MSSNLAESFNAWIVYDRELHVYQMLDRLWIKMMVKYATRRRSTAKWNTYLCPQIEKKLQTYIETGKHWDVSRSTECVLEVHAEYSFVVDLQHRTCSSSMGN